MSGIQLRHRRWSSCRHGRRNNRHREELMVMKYGVPALLSLMALKYQQGIQTPFDNYPWLMSISIFGMLVYFSSGNIILRLSIAADDASSASHTNIKIKDNMILMIETLHTILGFSVVAILASLLCQYPQQHSSKSKSSSSRSWSIVYMTFIFLSALIIPTYYSLIVSCFHRLYRTILALFGRYIQKSPNKEASTTVEQANVVHDDVVSLPV